MTLVNRALGIMFAIAAMAALVMASHAPLTSHASSDAMLRLAWSARPERIETCRAQSEEELAKLPQHMRQPVVCEGVTAHYRLTVRRGHRVIADRLVHAGGLRQDRRLFVFEEIALPAGEALVDVRFERVDAASPSTPVVTGPRQQAPTDPRQRGETVPPQLAFSQRLDVAPRTAILVTYDPGRRELILVTGR